MDVLLMWMMGRRGRLGRRRTSLIDVDRRVLLSDYQCDAVDNAAVSMVLRSRISAIDTTSTRAYRYSSDMASHSHRAPLETDASRPYAVARQRTSKPIA